MAYDTPNKLRSKDDLRERMGIEGDFILLMPYGTKAELEGSVLLRWDEVKEKAPDLLPDRDAKIVVHEINPGCGMGKKAQQTLQGSGHEHEMPEKMLDFSPGNS